jgi:hypothetical protein
MVWSNALNANDACKYAFAREGVATASAGSPTPARAHSLGRMAMTSTSNKQSFSFTTERAFDEKQKLA